MYCHRRCLHQRSFKRMDAREAASGLMVTLSVPDGRTQGPVWRMVSPVRSALHCGALSAPDMPGWTSMFRSRLCRSGRQWSCRASRSLPPESPGQSDRTVRMVTLWFWGRVWWKCARLTDRTSFGFGCCHYRKLW